MILHIGIIHDAMEDLKLSDRLVSLFFHSGKVIYHPPGSIRVYPSVPLSKHPDKVRPAPINILQADVQRFTGLTLIRRNISQFAFFPDSREDIQSEFISFCNHVTEG